MPERMPASVDQSLNVVGQVEERGCAGGRDDEFGMAAVEAAASVSIEVLQVEGGRRGAVVASPPKHRRPGAASLQRSVSEL